MLFAGPTGTGKRTVALRLAQAVNCEAAPDLRPCGTCRSCRTIAAMRHPDVRLFFPIRMPKASADEDAELEDVGRTVIQATLEASQEYCLSKPQPPVGARLRISIQTIRWLRLEVSKPPLLARRRFFIFLHAHQMTQEAANAFLKTLEEPQKQTTYILTTDSLTSILPTIRSRCRQVRFAPIPADAVTEWLVASAGAGKADAELAAQVADGSLGSALRFIEEPEQFISEPVARFFALPEAQAGDILATMNQLHRTPMPTIVGTLLFLYRQALLVKHGVDSPYARRNPAVREKARIASADYLRRAVKYLTERLNDCRLSINPRLFIYTLLAAFHSPREVDKQQAPVTRRARSKPTRRR